MHWMHGGWWGGGFSMILFWGLVIVAVVWFVKDRSEPYARRTGENYSHQESALDILQKRYAAGEISKEEYQEIKAELGRR